MVESTSLLDGDGGCTVLTEVYSSYVQSGVANEDYHNLLVEIRNLLRGSIKQKNHHPHQHQPIAELLSYS